MIDKDWNAWVNYHATLFGLSSAEDAKMMRLWRPLLAGCGYSELMEASAWIAIHESAKWRTQHADLLHQRVTGQRFRAHRENQERLNREAQDLDCMLCRGAGLVIVPHHENVLEATWMPPQYTEGVACTCRKGVAVYNRIQSLVAAYESDKRRIRVVPLMSLDAYEARVPGWQDMLVQRDEYRKGIDDARSAARKAHASGKAIDVAMVRERLAQIGRIDDHG